MSAECPACGCAIFSGLLHFTRNGQALICCSKRCLTKCERALASGTPLRRRAPSFDSDVPVEAESCWANVSADVLCLLGAHMPLRDRLAAAMTCSHWRAGLTRGVTHLSARVDDITTPHARRTSLATACAVLDSARRNMPQVSSLHLTVYHRCFDHRALMQHAHAVSKWAQLRHLRVDTDMDAGPISRLTHEDVASMLDWMDESVPRCTCEECLGQWREFEANRAYARRVAPRRGRLRDPPPIPLQHYMTLDHPVLGALGRLTRLESLSLTGNFFADLPDLYNLSTLVNLTSLELLSATHPFEHERSKWYMCYPDGRGTDLVHLTRLQRLRISTQMLSPYTLAQLPSLHHLHLDQLDMEAYQGNIGIPDVPWTPYDATNLSERLRYMPSLRSLTISLLPRESLPRVEYSRRFLRLVQAIGALTAKQRELHAEAAAAALAAQGNAAAGSSQGPNQAPPPRPGRRHRATGSPGPGSAQPTPRQSLSGASASAQLTTAAPAQTEYEPLAVHIGPCEPRLCVKNEARTHGGPPLEPSPGEEALVAAWGAGPELSPRLQLSPELLEALAEVEGLRHLDLAFADGAADNMHKLPDLTRLTHLALRCLHKVRLTLGAWDAERLAYRCSQLVTLQLHAAADCIIPAALAHLAACPKLRVLDLRCHTYLREAPLSRWDLRCKLLAALPPAPAPTAVAGSPSAAPAPTLGGPHEVAGNSAPASDGAEAVPRAMGDAGDDLTAMAAADAQLAARCAAEARGQVDKAVDTLLTLQQLLRAMDVYEVQASLMMEADTRMEQAQRARELAEAAAAEAQQEEAAGVAAAELVAALAAAAVTEAAAPGAAQAGAGAAEEAAGDAAQAAGGELALGAVAAVEAADAPPGPLVEQAVDFAGLEPGVQPGPAGAGAQAPAAAPVEEPGATSAQPAPQAPPPPAPQPDPLDPLAGLPALPLWVQRVAYGGTDALRPWIPHDGPEGEGAVATTGGSGGDTDAAGGGAGASMRLGPPTVSVVDLGLTYGHELSLDAFRELRAMLLPEELVPCPSCSLSWAPQGLEVLSLRGFHDLVLPGKGRAAAGAEAEEAGAGALPRLRVLRVGLRSQEAVDRAREGVVALGLVDRQCRVVGEVDQLSSMEYDDRDDDDE